MNLKREFCGSDLSPTLYLRFERLASHYMRRERRGHTYQPMDLVNEALARILSADLQFENRRHFFATCARQMRRILVNHAKAKLCDKRGVTESITTEQIDAAISDTQVAGIIEVDDLLTQFERIDAEAAEALGLCYFVGLTLDETAKAMSVSESTVTRKLRFARVWMQSKLQLACK